MCWSNDMCGSGNCNQDLVQKDLQGRAFGTCMDVLSVSVISSQRARRRLLVGASSFDGWA